MLIGIEPQGETVDRVIFMRITFLLAFAIALGYAVLRLWRRRNVPDPTDKSTGFRPRIGFTRLDGMESLSLLLANGSKTYVWAEEIEIFLTDLIANEQTAEPSYREIHKIRQMVGPRDMLPISLAEVIYKAAGDPQRKYSCILSSVLRYRIEEERLEKNLENYRVRMIGLTASGIHRERKPVQPIQTQDKSKDEHALATKPK
jgi:hypothetical protein